MSCRVCSIVLLLAVTTVAIGQHDSTHHDFRSFQDHFFIGPVIKSRTLIFGIESITNNEEIRFQPNSSSSIGLNTFLFDLNLEATFSIPLNDNSISRFGESNVRDLQIAAVGRRFFGDAYWQKYSGFFYEYPSLSVSGSEPFPRRPDIATRNFGVSFGYVFNHDHFSLRSAYTFVDRQLNSRGSPLLGFVVSTFDIKADSSLFPKALAPLGEDAAVNEIRFTSLGFAPGYSYTAVIKKWFLNLSFSAGPAHYWIRYNLPQSGFHYNIDINWLYSLRIALGYNADRFFWGLTYNGQGRSVAFEQIRFNNSIGTLRLVLGYRFREKGFLTKSVWDFVPLP